MSFATRVSRRYWVVRKEIFKTLLDIPEAAIVDPNSVKAPPGLDLNQWMILDQMVPRSHLGPGTLELELAIKETWSGTAGASPSSMPPLGCPQALALPNEKPQCIEEPPQKRLCILKREVSDDTHLENSLEHMAIKLREAFDSVNFYSEDGQ